MVECGRGWHAQKAKLASDTKDLAKEPLLVARVLALDPNQDLVGRRPLGRVGRRDRALCAMFAVS